MPKYLLDTNICIYIANKRPQSVLQKFEKLKVGDVAMSIITYGELHFGIQKSKQIRKSTGILNKLIELIPPLDLSADAAKHYALTRKLLEKKGKPIGNNDLWIAAHALSLNIPIITNNTKEFSRISSLKIENWV